MFHNRTASLSRRNLAMIAGLLYLIVAVFGGFAQLVRTGMIESGNAAATAANVLDAEALFRAAVASDLVAFSSEVLLAVVIYRLLHPVSESLAMLAAALRLVQAAVLGLNMLNQAVVLLLLAGNDYLAVFEPAQLHALALFFLEAHGYGYLIGLVFFGLHNIVLGYLVLASGFIPRILGILLMTVVSTAYLMDSFGHLLFAGYPSALSTATLAPAVVVEFAFIVWLVAKGDSNRHRKAPTPAFA